MLPIRIVHHLGSHCGGPHFGLRRPKLPVRRRHATVQYCCVLYRYDVLYQYVQQHCHCICTVAPVQNTVPSTYVHTVRRGRPKIPPYSYYLLYVQFIGDALQTSLDSLLLQVQALLRCYFTCTRRSSDKSGLCKKCCLYRRKMSSKIAASSDPASG